MLHAGRTSILRHRHPACLPDYTTASSPSPPSPIYLSLDSELALLASPLVPTCCSSFATPRHAAPRHATLRNATLRSLLPWAPPRPVKPHSHPIPCHVTLCQVSPSRASRSGDMRGVGPVNAPSTPKTARVGHCSSALGSHAPLLPCTNAWCRPSSPLNSNSSRCSLDLLRASLLAHPLHVAAHL